MKNVHTDFRPIDAIHSINSHSSLLLLYFLYVKPQQLNFLAACLTFGNLYLDILASLIIIVLSLLMLLITMQQPEMLMVYFETSGRDIVFTWRMRLIADIIQIMFLFSCGIFGIAMGIITLVLLLVTYTLAKKRPDIFS